MTILLVAEHDNEALNEATNKAMTAAVAMGGDVHVLVAGSGCCAVAEQAAKLAGAAKVLLADGEGLSAQLAEFTENLRHQVHSLVLQPLQEHSAAMASAVRQARAFDDECEAHNAARG